MPLLNQMSKTFEEANGEETKDEDIEEHEESEEEGKEEKDDKNVVDALSSEDEAGG